MNSPIRNLQIATITMFVGRLMLTAAQQPKTPYFINKPERAPCNSTSQCKHGLCCLKNAQLHPTCQPLAKLAQRCSITARAGVYKKHCPCADYARCLLTRHICVLPPPWPHSLRPPK
uniref:Putative secreted peptide n=1 Tax=Rhipicephalus pulchellus TaxID=72859 RepID=L7MC67_RHIPC